MLQSVCFTLTVQIMQMTSDVQAAEDRAVHSKMANRDKGKLSRPVN